MKALKRFAKRFKRRRPKPSQTKPQVVDAEPNQPLPLLAPTAQVVPESTSLPPSTDTYGAFSRLPTEIRRQILTYAFGERTVHIDLSWRHPLVRRSAPVSGAGPQGASKKHCGLGEQLVEDNTLPKRWQWFSCVCHRSAETENPTRIAFFKLETTIWPFEDKCLEGEYCDCGGSDRPGQGQEDCFLGVIGWLLACRGAYSDGVDVLFSTNTFYLSSVPLLLNMRRLISPNGVDKIKSVQLALGEPRLTRFAKDPLVHGLWKGTDKEEKACAFPQVCSTVPNLFSNVRRLELYVQSQLWPSRDVPVDQRVPLLVRNVMDPLEDMVRSLGADKQVVIAVTLEAHKALMQKHGELEGAAFRWEPEAGADDSIERYGRFWRALGSDDNGNEVGYWLRTGWNDHDMVNHPYMTYCFGSGGSIFDLWGYYKREAALGRSQYGSNVTFED
ncbi:uncharacterized protein F5Z01DRAFT_140062 [Emericellopsis atlantica]|uniref:DUF7730 domain-containing protein n=1 Tax=Emericellopsis atlantica TaxID=2614577 RepID=A0A9P8CNU1_9HYPO|nr:uncharacterized protein F5Z01DRAFT_140062 [Emericellopsis atlantica]KAG9253482.1 hypothetical protein F5Z01DRAFT_140062 [Emericellopsis atlantica]